MSYTETSLIKTHLSFVETQEKHVRLISCHVYKWLETSPSFIKRLDNLTNGRE